MVSQGMVPALNKLTFYKGQDFLGIRCRHVRLLTDYRWMPYVYFYYNSMEDRKYARGISNWESELYDFFHEKIFEFYHSVCLSYFLGHPLDIDHHDKFSD